MDLAHAISRKKYTPPAGRVKLSDDDDEDEDDDIDDDDDGDDEDEDGSHIEFTRSFNKLRRGGGGAGDKYRSIGRGDYSSSASTA